MLSAKGSTELPFLVAGEPTASFRPSVSAQRARSPRGGDTPLRRHQRRHYLCTAPAPQGEGSRTAFPVRMHTCSTSLPRLKPCACSLGTTFPEMGSEIGTVVSLFLRSCGGAFLSVLWASVVKHLRRNFRLIRTIELSTRACRSSGAVDPQWDWSLAPGALQRRAARYARSTCCSPHPRAGLLPAAGSRPCA